MKKIIFFILCIFLSIQTYGQKIKWLEGSWQGEGYQRNAITQRVWGVTMVYTSQDKKILIEYPSLGCGGIWVLKKVEKNRAIFMEQLNYSQDKCMNGCKIVVSFIDSNFINVAFYDVGNEQHHVGAIALLKKRSTI